MAKSVVLLTASWCPRSPAARALWQRLRDRFGFEYRELDIDSPEGQEAADRWHVMGVPTAIVNDQLVTEVFDESRALQLLEVIND